MGTCLYNYKGSPRIAREGTPKLAAGLDTAAHRRARRLLAGRVEKELDHEKFLDLLEEVEIHVTDMLIRILTRRNPKSPNRLLA